MQPTATQIETIRRDFTTMKSKEDLLGLLNTAKRQLDGSEYRPIELRSLNYYANPSLCKSRYRSFTVKKKSGGKRVIHAPTRGLKAILKAVNHVFQCLYEPHRAAMGFIRNKSIRDNAAQHLGALYVYNIDLKDFFYSFDRNRVKLGFMSEPFGLRDEREPMAFLLASLCTHPIVLGGELRSVLPQGSPTSPTITNILCRTLDRRLAGMAKRLGIKYTRYADDITFSSMSNVFRTEVFQTELKRIIEEDQSLVINPSKTRLQTEHYRQEVTGLTVNEKVNVPRRYVKHVRMYLHYWEKYGYDKANSIMAHDYPQDRGHDRKRIPALENVLHGKLLYLKMVKGETDSTYRGLNDRFTKLANPMPTLVEQSQLQNENAVVGEFFTDSFLEFFGKSSQSTSVGEEVDMGAVVKMDITDKPGEEVVPHNPEKVVALLKKFTKKGTALRDTVHVWDAPIAEADQTIGDFYEALSRTYKDMASLQTFNWDLWMNKIYRFVYQRDLYDWQKEKGFFWGRHKLKIGWNYPDTVANWSREHYDGKGELARLPMSMELPLELRPDKPVGNRSIVTFEDVVQIFKLEIEFREDDLYLMMKRATRKALRDGLWPEDKEGMKRLEKRSFYTDTEKVENAVYHALEMFNARSAFQKYSVNCYRDNESNQYVLELLQYGSFSERELTSDKLVNLYENGDFPKVVANCVSVCHLSVESKFIDENNQLKSYELELLYHDIQRPFKWRKKLLDKDAEGFKFKFYFPD